MPKKLTYEYVKSVFGARGFELLETEYINSATKMRYRCPLHPDKELSITFHDVKDGHGCPFCKADKSAREKRIPFTTVKAAFEDAGYILLEDEYVNGHQKLRYTCPNHPEKNLSIGYSQLKCGTRCPFCSGVGRLTYDEVRAEFEALGYNLLDDKYINAATPIRYRCGLHPAKIRKISYSNLSSGQRCADCAGVIRYSFDMVKEEFSIRGYELLETEYKHNREYMRFKCPNHPDKETSIAFKELRKGRGCIHCSREFYRGENHPAWNPTLTAKEREKKRYYPEYYAWRRDVFDHDKYTCQICGDNRGGNLIAHHLDGYDWCKEKRTDVLNGVTLCDMCHDIFHTIYRFGGNTKEQFAVFSKKYRKAAV